MDNAGRSENLKIQKICERCGATFECNAGNIQHCACNKIVIPEELRTEISSRYKDCLCVNCLKELGKSRDDRW